MKSGNLQKFFTRKIGSRVTRSVVLIPKPIPGETYGYIYTAEILACNDEFVTVHLTRRTLASAGTQEHGSLVRFGDWAIRYREFFGLDQFWYDVLTTVDELDSAMEVDAGQLSISRK